MLVQKIVLLSVTLIRLSISVMFNTPLVLDNCHIVLPDEIPDCEPLLRPILDEDPALNTLVDPVLTSEAELNDYREEMTALHSCLDNGLAARTPIEKRAYILSEYFIIFADGYLTPERLTSLELIDLNMSDDAAVLELKREVGLSPADGYIFLRKYVNRQAMPPRVAHVFMDPNVSGATFLTRYIAVLAEQETSWRLKALQTLALPRTISHELVHAYINTTIGPSRYADLPVWYHEGIAIYFSHSGEDQSIITPDMIVNRTSTDAYSQYELNFRYLENRVGRKQLMDNILTSVLQVDETILYSALGIENIEELQKQAAEWQESRTRKRIWIVLVFALILGWGLFHLLPYSNRET